jgi:hypothetical protein
MRRAKSSQKSDAHTAETARTSFRLRLHRLVDCGLGEPLLRCCGPLVGAPCCALAARGGLMLARARVPRALLVKHYTVTVLYKTRDIHHWQGRQGLGRVRLTLVWATDWIIEHREPHETFPRPSSIAWRV